MKRTKIVRTITRRLFLRMRRQQPHPSVRVGRPARSPIFSRSPNKLAIAVLIEPAPIRPPPSRPGLHLTRSWPRMSPSARGDASCPPRHLRWQKPTMAPDFHIICACRCRCRGLASRPARGSSRPRLAQLASRRLAVVCWPPDRAEDVADAASTGVVAPKRTEQGFSALRLARVATHRAEDHRQRRGDRAGGLCVARAELLADLLQPAAGQLGEDFIGQSGHGRLLRGAGSAPEPHVSSRIRCAAVSAGQRFQATAVSPAP